ncbi:MAG: diguanylate cyclase [Phycisphaerae bacterium]
MPDAPPIPLPDDARPSRTIRLLLLEDDPDQTELMLSVLAEQWPNSTVVHAASGADVLKLDLAQFDLALFDLHLPDCTGLELMRRIRATHDLPVILITGERIGETAAEAIRAGAMDYIVKYGDYIQIVPVVIEKTLALLDIRAANRRLEQELLARNSELERLNEQLREMAAHDPLTGLYNRRHFGELLTQHFSESVRYDTDLTCMMLDLDEFKQINDTLGHPAGDRVLVLCAEVLRRTLRQSDLPARYGGDEFVALLPRTCPAEARSSARRIATEFKAAIARQMPQAARVTLSIGLASREHGQPPSAEALVRLSDQALYLAKAGGRDRIMVISPSEVGAGA